MNDSSKINYKYENNFFHIYGSTLDSKQAFEDVLDTIMEVIKTHQKMDKKDPFIWMTVYENGTMIEDSEYSCNENFWTKVADFPECYPKVDQYIDFVIQHMKNNEDEQWESDEIPLAGVAAYKLAMADKRFIPFYTQCLAVWDMGHEVEQAEHIEQIVESHPWTSEIEELIIARATCNGQYDFEQLDRLESVILENNDPLEKSEFFTRLVHTVNEELSYQLDELLCSEKMSNAAKNIVKQL